MTPEERARYSYYQKKLYNDRDELQAAEARGKEEGIQIGEARGENKKTIEIAKKMLVKGSDPAFISAVTGLNEDLIHNLHHECEPPRVYTRGI
jgi:hypothetical protein